MIGVSAPLNNPSSFFTLFFHDLPALFYDQRRESSTAPIQRGEKSGRYASCVGHPVLVLSLALAI